MLGCGKMIKCMVLDLLLGKMVKNMKGIIFKEKNMAKDHSHGLMAKSIKVDG